MTTAVPEIVVSLGVIHLVETDRCPFKRAEAMLRRYVFALCGDGRAVDDLVQELLLRGLQRRADMRGEHMDRFLRGIARRVVQEHYRFRRRSLREVASIAEAVAADEPLESPLLLAERLQHLRSALNSLPLVARRILEQRYQEGRSAEAIGAALGVSAGAVRVTCLRLRRRLAAELR